MLNIIRHFPNELLDCPANELYKFLPGPTLIHLTGKREPPVFVSVLLHGNETTGWLAVQAVMQKYKDQELHRSLSIFIGNVEAARYGVRRLDEQVDYNRVWPHSETKTDCPERSMMQQVIDEMRKLNVFISIDIHNNTGINPHYACINKLEPAFFQLAVLFNRTVIYFTNPKGVQSQAFADLCPAVTTECGKIGHEAGTLHAAQYIEACLGLVKIPTHPIIKQDIDLYHTVAIVKVPESINFSFTDQNADLLVTHDVETMNFSELDQGTFIGKIATSITSLPLSVKDDNNNEVADRYFRLDGNSIVTIGQIMPTMLSVDEDIIRKDCLCYLMERMHL